MVRLTELVVGCSFSLWATYSLWAEQQQHDIVATASFHFTVCIPELSFHPIEPQSPYIIEITAATWLSGHGATTRETVFTQEGGKYNYILCLNRSNDSAAAAGGGYILSTTIYNITSVYLAVPSVAPTVATVRRDSATTVVLTWDPLSLVESRGFLTDYKVAYMSTLRSSCPQIDLETASTTLSVDKENTQTVISNLDPGLEYCVAIAASTVAGTSDFSDTQKVPCKCTTNHRMCLYVTMISPSLLHFSVFK